MDHFIIANIMLKVSTVLLILFITSVASATDGSLKTGDLHPAQDLGAKPAPSSAQQPPSHSGTATIKAGTVNISSSQQELGPFLPKLSEKGLHINLKPTILPNSKCFEWRFHGTVCQPEEILAYAKNDTDLIHKHLNLILSEFEQP